MTLNRELARLSALEDSAQEQRDLLRTLESIYWAVSLFIGIIVVTLAPVIAYRWVNPQHLSGDAVVSSLRIMGLVIALQFPFSFYQGGLTGLQRQVLVNGILVISGTLRGVGAVLVLWLFSPTIQAFLAWQLVISAASTGAFYYSLWQSLSPSKRQPRFRKELLHGIWKFAASVSGNAIIGVMLTQMDKVILSKILSLENFGYYTLAATVASVLWSVIVPINTAFFPNFTQLFELRDEVRLAEIYHRACQIVTVALVPIGFTLVFFSREVIYLWTRNQITAERTYVIVALLVIGTMINGLSSMAIYLQYASGWPQLIMYSNLFSAVLLVPAIAIMANYYGAIGAASVWIAINSVYVIFTIPIMHRRLLTNEKWKWYFVDVGLPLSGALAFGAVGRWLMPADLSWLILFAYIGCFFMATLSICICLSTYCRNYIYNFYKVKYGYN